MSHLNQIAAISALVALTAVLAACTSSSEAEESSDRFAVVQDGKSSSAGTPATRTPKERSEPDPSEMLLRLAAIPPAQRTVGQDYVLATLLTADGKRHQAFEALASAVSKGFSDVDKLENDKGLYSLHSDAKWAQVLLFTQDNKVSGRKISPPQASTGPRARPQLRPRQRPRLNVPSPDWTLTDINGDLVRLSDLRGNIVVLDFWATWCGPCKQSMPLIDKFVRDLKREDINDVLVYSVNVWERRPGLALPWWNRQNYSMELLFGDRSLTAAYAVQGIPHIVVIDADGIVRQSQSGAHPDMARILKTWTDQARKKS